MERSAVPTLPLVDDNTGIVGCYYYYAPNRREFFHLATLRLIMGCVGDAALVNTNP
jgi:hypothetical protein